MACEKMGGVSRSLRFAAALALVLLAACTDGEASPSGPTASATQGIQFAAQMATVDLYTGVQQRAQIGVFGTDPEQGTAPLGFGTIDVAYSYLGADGSATPEPGPTGTGHYVAAYGFPQDGTQAIDGASRGVYQTEVTFDQAGLWQAEVTFEPDGLGSVTLATTFPVVEHPAYPAPGDRAPRTNNLTLESADVDPSSIDSLAVDGGSIPDPELHEWTVEDAIAQHRPVLLIVGTPAYCTSQICGPETEAVMQLAKRYPDRAVYIHLELWKDFDGQVINEGAAEWVYRDGDAFDPWLFLIDADGRVVDRWMPLFDFDEVAAALEALPSMKAS
jgi:hypothetical protein